MEELEKNQVILIQGAIDIEVNYDGEYTVEKGIVTLKPSNSDVGKSKDLELNYGGNNSKAQVNYKIYDYNLEPETNSYEFNVNEDGSIIINNNFFSGEVEVIKTSDGFIIRDKNNPEIFIEITGDIEVILS